MAHTLPPISERRSEAPDLPFSLAEALERVRGHFSDLEGWEILDEACRQYDRPDEAAGLYTEALASKLSPEDLADVGRSAADFCEEWYEETGPVLEMLSMVLDADPSQTWAFDRLTVLLTVSAQWEELLKAYDTALNSCEDNRRRELLLAEAAKVARDFASRPEVASDYLKKLLLLRPDDEQLAIVLEKRLDEQGRHQDLIDVWSARLPVLSGAQVLKTRLLIATRHLEALEDAESSYLCIEEFLEEGGSGDSACGTLDKISQLKVASKDVRRQALKLLEKIHSEADRPREVISVLGRALALAESDVESIDLHCRTAELLNSMGDSTEALGHFAEAMKLDPASDAVRAQALGLAESSGEFAPYVRAVIASAELADAGPLRVRLLGDAAKISHEALGNREAAIDLYVRVESDKEADSARRLYACQQLSELLFEAGRKEELLTFLEKRADLEPEEVQAATVLAQAAQLASELHHQSRALALWSKRLEIDPQDLLALTSKIEILAQLPDYGGLVEALVARANCGIEEAAQRADLVCAAGVLSDRMEEVGKAISMWKAIEARFGRVAETIDALIDLNHAAEDYEQVVELLSEGIAEEPDLPRRVAYYGRLGDTLRVHLKLQEEGLEAYRAALELDPTSVQSLQGLTSLTSSEKHAHLACETLAAAHRRAGDLAAVLALGENRLQAAPTDKFRASVLLESARIQEDAGDLSAALLSVGRAFSLVPSESNESELQRLGEATGEFYIVSDSYKGAIDAIDDQSLQFPLLLALGTLEETRLGRSLEASRAFRAAVVINAGQADLVKSLVRTALNAGAFGDAAFGLVQGSQYEEVVVEDQIQHFSKCAALTNDWPSVLAGLSAQIAKADDLSKVVDHDLKVQLAIWYRDRANDADAAELVLIRAVQDLSREDSLRMLAELQRRAPGRALVSTLTALSKLVSDDLAVLREAGSVALLTLGDGVLATPILQKAFNVASERFAGSEGDASLVDDEAREVSAWATDSLVELAIADKRPEVAVDLLEASALLPFEEEERNARRYRAAEVATSAGLDARAAVLCERILEVDRYHEGAITVLSLIHEKAGRLDELLELRRRELALQPAQERRLFLRLDQSRVLGQTGADLKERVEILRENLVDLPGHAATVDALSAIHTAEEAYEDLAVMLEAEARAIVDRDPERAAQFWERAGRIVDEHFDDLERLASDFKLSASAAPNVYVLDRLAELAEAEQAWESEVSWLQLRLSMTPGEVEPSDRRRVVLRLANALVASEEREAARDCLHEELSRDPAADELRQLLANIYQELQQWEALSHLLAAGVEYVQDPATQISYLKRAAIVERRRLSNLEAAIPLLEAATLLDPSDRGLTLLLADTLRTAGRLEAAVALLQNLLSEFGRRRTKQRAAVHTQLARIAQATGDLEEALEQAESAAKIERTDPIILMLVGQLAREKGQLERAEQAYQTLALIASRRAATESEEDFEEVGESTILFELYRIAEEKGQVAQSRELLESALDVASRNSDEAARLADMLIQNDKLDLLLNALSERLDTGLEGDLAARILVTKADVLEMSGRTEDAFIARKLALTETPHDGLLIDATRKLAERCGATREFWATIVRLAEENAQNPHVAGELWYRAGLAAETEDEDPVRAGELFELAQMTGHKPKRGFLALDRVLNEGAEPERVQAALLRFVSAGGVESSPDVLGDALYRLADFELSSQRLEIGAEHLLHALEVDAQELRALSMLEPIVREGKVSEAIALLFLRVCRKVADQETLLLAYREAAMTDGIDINTLHEGIELARVLDDGVALREMMSRAIGVATERDLGASIRTLLLERAGLARMDRESQLEADLLEQAVICSDPQDRFEIELRRAECLSEDLSDIAGGQAILERLFEENSEESRIWRPLLALYRDAGKMDAVERLIARVEDHVSDQGDLEALKMERVRLLVRDDRLEEAERELRITLKERPHMADAAGILAEILRKNERWVELKELVEGLFNGARDRRDSKLVERFGLELAKLVVEEDRAEAISVLNAGLPFAKHSHEYLSYLRSLYTEEDEQGDLCDVMEALLSLKSGVEARNLAFELYNKRNSLEDEFGAGRALEIAVGAAPDQDDLVQFYVEFLHASEDHSRLAETLMLQAARLGKGEAGATKYAEAARIFDEELSDPERAAFAISKAYDCDPSDMLYLEKGAGYLVSLGKVDEALARLKLAIDSGDEMALADLLELRANIIRQDRASDRDAMTQAATDLGRALELLIPEEQEEAIRSSRVEILKELRSLHQIAADSSSERKVVLELATVLKASGDGVGGIETLSSWLREHSDDTDVAAQLGATATEAGDHPSAVFAYEKLLAASDGSLRTNAVLLLADAAEASGSPLDARSALEQAFVENPVEERLRDRLRAMYEAGGEYEELAGILLTEADKSNDPIVRAALFVDIGDLYAKAENGEAACSAYEQALEVTDAPYPVTSKLAQAYITLGDVKRAEEILTEAVRAHGKRRSPELALLQGTLARVSQAMGNDDAMFAWLEAALMSDRNNADIASELAMRAQDQGRYEIAVKALQSLTLSKVQGPIGKAEAYFRQAQIAQAQGDEKKALLMARRAQSTDGGVPGVTQFLNELGG